MGTYLEDLAVALRERRTWTCAACPQVRPLAAQACAYCCPHLPHQLRSPAG
ncbi:hypothetical protein ACWGQ5_22965 [Streptomyces sp. NPDC055722]